MDLVRGAPGLRYVFSPSQHAKKRREMFLIMTEGGVLVRPSRGQFENVPNGTSLISQKDVFMESAGAKSVSNGMHPENDIVIGRAPIFSSEQ